MENFPQRPNIEWMNIEKDGVPIFEVLTANHFGDIYVGIVKKDEKWGYVCRDIYDNDHPIVDYYFPLGILRQTIPKENA